MDVKMLKFLLKRVEALECKGMCTEFCDQSFAIGQNEDNTIKEFCEENEIPFTSLQRNFLEVPEHSLACQYLKAGRCSIYPVRPIVCRVWGAADTLSCPWECKIRGEKKPISENAAYELMTAAFKGEIRHEEKKH